MLNNAFINLANGEEFIHGAGVADALADLELSDGNIV